MAGGIIALSDSIKVRLREGQALVYTAQAEQRGVGMAAYIRDHLDQADRIDEELASIRAAMFDMCETMNELRDQVAERLVTPTQEEQVTGEPNAMRIEILLLLRALSPPQKLQMVRAEIERQGLEPVCIPGPPTRSR